jgi:hypothetical protein
MTVVGPLNVWDYANMPGMLLPVDDPNHITAVPGGGYLVTNTANNTANAYSGQYPPNTQMQGASLIPYNPVTGDMVCLVFNGSQWIRIPGGEEAAASLVEKLPTSGDGFSLEDITGAEAFIEEINANRAEAYP